MTNDIAGILITWLMATIYSANLQYLIWKPKKHSTLFGSGKVSQIVKYLPNHEISPRIWLYGLFLPRESNYFLFVFQIQLYGLFFSLKSKVYHLFPSSPLSLQVRVNSSHGQTSLNSITKKVEFPNRKL